MADEEAPAELGALNRSASAEIASVHSRCDSCVPNDSSVDCPCDASLKTVSGEQQEHVEPSDLTESKEFDEKTTVKNTAEPDGSKIVANHPSQKDLKIPDSPPNGFVKPHIEGNGIVKLADCLAAVDGKSTDSGPGLKGDDNSNCDAGSNLTTDSEGCATPSTEKTQVSDSESEGENVEGSPAADTVPLCDALAKTTIADAVECHEAVASSDIECGIKYIVYESERQMPDIMRLITKDLSEPYSIYTYRYFIHNWPKLCFLAMDGTKCCGAIVCKLDLHKKMVRRGYIAMLAVDQDYRRQRIGSHLVLKAIKAMVADDCDEVVLETEITNRPALHLYENLGFVRDKRLFRYYLNGVDALRLKLWLR